VKPISSLIPLPPTRPAEPPNDLFPITPPIGDLKTITPPMSDRKPITPAPSDPKTITDEVIGKRSQGAVRGEVARKIRAARALLDWSAEELAAAAGVGVATIRRVEAAGAGWNTTEAVAAAIVGALRAAGVSMGRDKDGVYGIEFRQPAAPDAAAE
jgi:DNA-binding XRE family transcriptional regulator